MFQLTFMAAVRVRDSRDVDDVVKLKVEAISSSSDDTSHVKTLPAPLTLTASKCVSRKSYPLNPYHL